ncbi:hypothetical protein CYLTODRAFT_426389 [Cylindrobasidium torrendii FP15055 ss-10]|uniref:Secreted protein n=1 Tax=Cylindrobasidium torrendii FP15055 ss-10 TaxID=1314674 RepID=A0A0D7AYQ0_9AGAR|nr:hypothetical protein CYLTODRAFT_426389 [Cylindrobasidium torrendii FP15055 ss-10]
MRWRLRAIPAVIVFRWLGTARVGVDGRGSKLVARQFGASCAQKLRQAEWRSRGEVNRSIKATDYTLKLQPRVREAV